MQNNQNNKQIKAVMLSIQNQIKNLDQSSDIAKHYQDMLTSCEALVAKTDEFFKQQNDGTYKLVEEKDKQELLSIYQSIANSTVALNKIEDSLNKDEANNFVFENAKMVGDLISKDIRSLIKTTSPTSLPEIIQNGRTKVIDITGQSVNKIGAGQSTRQVIETNGKKAVFTENSPFDVERMVKENRDKYKKLFPQYAKLWNELSNPENFEGNRMMNLPRQKEQNGNVEVNFSYQDLVNLGLTSNFNDRKFLPLLRDEMSRDPNLCKIIYQYLADSNKILLQKGMQTYINSGKNEPVDERNSAMSVVAELLGMNKVLCHSEAVIIKDGDKEITGNLMDFAEGVDPANVDPNSELAKIPPSKIKITPECKKQISDLQILDYICGNLDRHGCNMFYQYDLSDKDHPKLIGIQGIDNDSSFINDDNQHSYIKDCNRMTGLAFLTVIDRSTAEKVKSITPAMMKIALQGLKIDPKAVDLALQRFTDLQTVLEHNAMSYDKTKTGTKFYVNHEQTVLDNITLVDGLKVEDLNINVVENETSWSKLNTKFKSFTKREKNNTLFDIVHGSIGGTPDMEDLTFDFQSEYNTRTLNHSEMLKSKDNIDNQIKTLASGTKRFRGSSKQYKNIQAEMKALQEKQKLLDFSSNSQALKEYKEDLSKVKEHVEAYLDRKKREEYNPETKKGEKYGTYTQNRINIMKDFKNVLDERIKVVDDCSKSLEKIRTRIDNKQRVVREMKAEALVANSKGLQNGVKKALDVNKAPVEKKVEKKDAPVLENKEIKAPTNKK